MAVTTQHSPPSNVHVQDMDKVEALEGSEHLEISHNNPVVDWTEDEEKALVRKIDLFLLPTIWIMYLLSYMDRNY